MHLSSTSSRGTELFRYPIDSDKQFRSSIVKGSDTISTINGEGPDQNLTHVALADRHKPRLVDALAKCRLHESRLLVNQERRARRVTTRANKRLVVNKPSRCSRFKAGSTAILSGVIPINESGPVDDTAPRRTEVRGAVFVAT